MKMREAIQSRTSLAKDAIDARKSAKKALKKKKKEELYKWDPKWIFAPLRLSDSKGLDESRRTRFTWMICSPIICVLDVCDMYAPSEKTMPWSPRASGPIEHAGSI